MADTPATNPPPEPAANPAMVVTRRRPASVNLREGQGDTNASLMDPANQSLADALRITYRILQVGMLGLFGMFAFSGLQSVQTGEKGIRLMLGAVQSDDLAPGFAFSLPRPLGEIVKIKTGVETLSLRTQFFPAVGAGGENQTIQVLAASARPTLDPAQDGAMLTGDLSLAHGRFTVQYQRRDIKANARNIMPDAEADMVKAAAIRGITHAAARLTIDEVYKNQAEPTRKGEFPALDSEARRLAQATLDGMNSGIEIVQFNVEDRQPPLSLITKFASVQSSQSDARREEEKARTERSETLANVAGEAASVLLDLIERYDKALGTKDPEAEAILQKINAAMEGKAIEIDGKPVSGRVTGRVAGQLSESQQYRSSIVSRAQADARVFDAKHAAFKVNPSVVINGDWTEALGIFLNRDTVMIFNLPATKIIDLLINRDPEIAKRQEQARTEAEAKRLESDRIRQLGKQPFEGFKNINTTTSD